jgi:hypothetical protein
MSRTIRIFVFVMLSLVALSPGVWASTSDPDCEYFAAAAVIAKTLSVNAKVGLNTNGIECDSRTLRIAADQGVKVANGFPNGGPPLGGYIQCPPPNDHVWVSHISFCLSSR